MDQSKPKHIVEGLDEDLDHIGSEFAKLSPALRLEDFYTFWTNANMDCLFANRFDPRELLEMITEVNKKLVSRIVDKENDLQSRLVALYLLLCISGQQPERLRRRIRLTCTDFIGFNHHLCADLRQTYSHDDASDAINLLLELKAINITEERSEYGPILLEQRKSSARPADGSMDLYELEPERSDNELDQIESTLEELEHLGEDYDYLRDLLNLNEVNDAAVEIESTGTLKEYLSQSKNLIREYKL